jgi:uncharacterized protein (DUF169 family)
MDYGALERQIMKSLGLQKRPVAVTFLEGTPEGIEKFSGSEPSSCSFWRLAAAGRSFYTVASDHYNCPVGSYTQNIPLPPERAKELDQVLALMAEIGYVRAEELAMIPQLPIPPRAVVYAPLGEAPVEPDVALFAGLASQVMLLHEAALRAGCVARTSTLGRPTCMAIPAALAHGEVVSSACIGNRVYTGLSEGEMYVVVAGRDLARVAAELGTVVEANRQLAEFHQARKSSLSTA